MSKKDIKDMYDKKRTSERDLILKDRILDFTRRNNRVLLDGIITNRLTMGPQVRDRFSSVYDVDYEFKELSKSNKFIKQSNIVNNPLRLGLLCSYADTTNRLFLTFLFLLNYSACINKYWSQGHDSKRMAFVLDNLINNNTDFKKYKNVLTVADKKVDAFEISSKNRFLKMTDEDIAYMAQDSYTRTNNSINVIATKYYEMDEETIKFIKKNVTTKNGKSIVNMNSIYDDIIRKSKEKLSVNNNILVSIQCDPFKKQNEMRVEFLDYALTNRYYESCEILEKIVYEFQKRNPSSDHKVFKKKFMSMSSARNLNEINDKIGKIIIKYQEDKNIYLTTIMRNEFRHDLMNYLILHIYKLGLYTMLN